jgi:hypothetical protein
MWLNFLTVNAMYIYWPVVLVGVTVAVLFLPLRVLYHRSRKWWAYSNVSQNLCDGFLLLTWLVASSVGGSIPG